MWLNEDAPLQKQDFNLAQPFVNTAGSLGFCPDLQSIPYLPRLGAFITNPISRYSRSPARSRTCLPYEGGFLLHTGLPNSGISRVIRQHKHCWAGSLVPVILHLLVETPETLEEMVRKIEGLENIMAVELGLPADCEPHHLQAFMDAALGELPVVVCLDPQQVCKLGDAIPDGQCAALHLVQPRGCLPSRTGEIVSGRLSGPGNFPVMLYMARQMIERGVPLIVDGDAIHPWQVKALQESGVSAIGLGGVLWQTDTNVIFQLFDQT